MRLEYEVWLSGVEYVILALTTDVKGRLFVSHMPEATLADSTVSAGLLPLNIAKIFLLFFLNLFPCQISLLTSSPIFLQGEIRATAFNDQADKFFPLLELNKVW